jgi:valyl-tRNA synthetase
VLKCKTEELKALFAADTNIIQSLVKTSQIDVLGPTDEEPTGCLKNVVTEDLSAYIKVKGLVDINLEIERLNKKNLQLNKFIEDIKKKNSSAKIPENIKKDNNDKIATYDNEKIENEKSIADLKSFM